MTKSSRIRTYSELRRIEGFRERFRYLALEGVVGRPTFGFDRWMNQQFYTSWEWRRLRQEVISRDEGCDLGVEGYDIHSQILIHHLNPMTVEDLIDGNDDILNPEYLITTRLHTHNAIHYSDERMLPRAFAERKPGDTKLW